MAHIDLNTTVFSKQTPTGTKGAASELQACIWLLLQGYEVYRNVSANGKFDIVAIKNKEINKIDVSFLPDARKFSHSKQETAKLNGGRMIYVLPNGSCQWDDDICPLIKIKHTCQYCDKDFDSYREYRVSCGSRECSTKIRNKRLKLNYDKRKEGFKPI